MFYAIKYQPDKKMYNFLTTNKIVPFHIKIDVMKFQN